VLYTLGYTPSWASRDPLATSAYGANGGNQPPARLADWDAYVTALATRYQGRIEAYELWNEVNLPSFWYSQNASGVADLVELTRRANQIIRRVDPAATLICPNFTAVSAPATLNMISLAAAAGLFQYCDAVGVHLYTGLRQGPERWENMVLGVRRTLAAAGVQLPIWNTEVAWGQAPQGVVYTGALGQALAERTLLMTLFTGVRRTYYYAWQNRWSGLWLDNGTQTTWSAGPSTAGQAWSAAADLLVGRQLLGCWATGSAPRVYGCAVSGRPGDPVGTSQLVTWTDALTIGGAAGTAWVTPPGRALRVRDLTGTTRAGAGKTRVSVGASPLWISYLPTAIKVGAPKVKNLPL
jgi:hypothetical protein